MTGGTDEPGAAPAALEPAPPLYDEMGMFREIADELGIPWRGQPAVERVDVEVEGRRVSALRWGDAEPELVLLHGGNQNAHTWDAVNLLLGRPALAVDLPGHGHSDWRDDRDYWPVTNAAAVAEVVAAHAPRAKVVVGMSLGGLTAIVLASRRPELVGRLVVVDVTPSVRTTLEQANDDRDREYADGATTFASFDDLLARSVAAMPRRSVAGLRRGLLHNARQQPDGTWRWRHDALVAPGGRSPAFDELWDDVGAVAAPTMLVLGGASIHVSDGDVAEFARRRPGLRVEVVDGAGHTVQGDRPVELTALVESFGFGPPGGG